MNHSLSEWFSLYKKALKLQRFQGFFFLLAFVDNLLLGIIWGLRLIVNAYFTHPANKNQGKIFGHHAFFATTSSNRSIVLAAFSRSFASTGIDIFGCGRFCVPQLIGNRYGQLMDL